MHTAQQSWSSPMLRTLWSDMDAARAALHAEVQGLSDAQLCFQPRTGGWSIGEILDHVSLSERSITRAVSRLLQTAAGLGQFGTPETEAPTADIDRATYNRPASAPQSVRPSPDRELSQLLADLADSRQRFEDVTRRADGLTIGGVTLPHFQLGELNLYQWLAVEAAHEAKHLGAIRRIKTDPRFPQA